MINKLVKFSVSFATLAAPITSFASSYPNSTNETNSAQIEIDQRINLMTSDQRLMVLKSLVKKMAMETSPEEQDVLKKYFKSDLLDISSKMESEPAPGKACE